ncbi:YdeI/OmpD-associated family protein [Nonomuraea harbinensis]|uniref:YdeI/OmpD-associated family protein n=1 Tax=Nonomuraea harbinensis TaxID=1286938 RepID=A0ABW1BYQ7_9ACTN|nr:YdeI/OmpD-associated family protein [Nonomuraea harbinensis]
MIFRTTVELSGRTATGIEVPPEVVAGLGAGRRPPVRVTINGYVYRSTVAPMGGRSMLPLAAENREGAGVAAGDEIEVGLELDTEPRTVTVPPDLAEALDRAPAAKAFFDGLSYSRQRRVVLQVEGAKKAETRQRRVADAVTRLAAGEA